MDEIGDITYDKILHCGVGFFARLFDEYLLDMMMPYNKEGIQEKIEEGVYRGDINVELVSYITALLSTFILHYFDKYEVTQNKEREDIIMGMLRAVDGILRKK